MNSLVAVVALQKRGYITKEAAARVLQKRASVVADHVADVTAAAFGKTAAEGGAFGRVARFGRKFLAKKPPAGEMQGWPEVMANIAKIMGVGAGLSAGSAAVGAAGHAIGRLGQKGKINSSRQDVMELLGEKNPEVAKQQAEVFDLVARYAPTLAADPMVASGIVRGIVTPSGGSASKTIKGIDMQLAKNLAEAESRVNESRSNTRFGRAHERMGAGVLGQFDLGGDKGR